MDTGQRLTMAELTAQHKKSMDEARQLEAAVMVTERNWNAMLKMQHDLFQQQMQLDADLKMLLTKQEAQTALDEMQENADEFARQAGSLNERYRRSLETVFPEIGAIKLNWLRPIALENLLTKLRKRTYRGHPIKEKTVQKYLTVVSAVLNDAKRDEIIEKNPARMIDLQDAKRKTQEIPTMEEMLKNEKTKMQTSEAFAIRKRRKTFAVKAGALARLPDIQRSFLSGTPEGT